MIKTCSPASKLAALYAPREALYAEVADEVLDGGGLTPGEVADAVVGVPS